jgi:hypothetical protein
MIMVILEPAHAIRCTASLKNCIELNLKQWAGILPRRGFSRGSLTVCTYICTNTTKTFLGLKTFRVLFQA